MNSFVYFLSCKVSLVRQATAYLALESYTLAIDAFETALGMSTTEDATRAKILNNIGVAHFQNGDHTEALRVFTSALEIQRQWLDGPIRRESIVYDASTTLGNMGKVYLHKGDYDLAYFVFEEACLVSLWMCERLDSFAGKHWYSPPILLRHSSKRQHFGKIMTLSWEA